MFPPEVIEDAERQAASELLFELLPARRSRVNPRAVKRKMSNFIVKRPEHRGQPPAERPRIRVLSAQVNGIGVNLKVLCNPGDDDD
jgi:hypothetical protein